MPRSTGVTVIAVLSMIGSVLTFLMGLLMVVVLLAMPLPKEAAAVPTAPVLFKAMMAMAALFYIGPAVWGVFTSIGLFRLRNWARISTIVFSVLLIGMGAFSALMMLLVPLPSVPRDAAGILTAVRVFMAMFWLGLLAIGIWWLVYFTRAKVKAQFVPAAPFAIGAVPPHFAQPSYAVPGAAAQFPALPEGHPRPISITVIAWFLLASCAFLPLAILLRSPAVLFTRLLTGRSAVVCYACMVVLNLCVGIGLLRLKRAAWWGAMACQFLNLINSAVFFLAPGGRARVEAMLDASYSIVPWVRAWQKQAGMQYDYTPSIVLGTIVGLGMIIVILFLLLRARPAFEN
jgi:hypothetical protein